MISIITPVYNSELYLRDCLESIQNQSYSDFEVVCVNDGSTDGSAAICKEFAEKDDRFRYFEQKNQGVSAARNLALKECNGDWLCFVDSDDIIHKDFLLNLSNNISPLRLNICGYTRKLSNLGEDNGVSNLYDSKQFIHLVINESICSPNIWMMLFNNNIIHKYKLNFTLGCVRNEDTEFYMKYITHIDEVSVSEYKGYYYRDNPDSAVHKFNKRSLTYIEAASRINSYLKENGVDNEDSLPVHAAVQYFIYHLARQGNRELYNSLHDEYMVRDAMKRLSHATRNSRKLVSWVYLILGRNLFFNILRKL